MIRINRQIMEKMIIRQKRMENKEISFSINNDSAMVNTAYFIDDSKSQTKKTR